MKQDEYLQSLIAKMDVTDYVDIPDTVTTADEFLGMAANCK